VRRDGLKVRLLPARQADAENERDCCGAVNDARDVGVILGVVIGVMEVVEV
jgi:galactitol-specific phosphotransferase system IIC component